MGYGGVFKTVVRIAATVVGGIVGGPVGAAIGSAVATGATGGSFKQSLLSGATAFIGASVAQGISGAVGAGGQAANVGSAIADGTASVGVMDGVTTVFDNVTGDVLAQGALAESASSIAVSQGAAAGMTEAAMKEAFGSAVIDAAAAAPATGSILDIASKANQSIENGVSQFTNGITDGGSLFGGFQNASGAWETIRTPYDFLIDKGTSTLGALGYKVAPELTTGFTSNALGTVAGGLTTWTLDQALLADTPEADKALMDIGLTPQAIATLKQEARNQLAQGKFDELTNGSVGNPFIREGQTEEQRAAAEEEFKKVMAGGIESYNTSLGSGPITQAQWDATFNDPALGQNILDKELGLRIDASKAGIDKVFSDKPFDFSLDDTVINSILDDQQQTAATNVANFEARGNLNALGGRTAQSELARQREKANTTLQGLGEGVLNSYTSQANDLKNSFYDQAGQYKLGDELFSVDPVKQQYDQFYSDKVGSLEKDLLNSVGQQQLFNTTDAIKSAGASQGLVSGAPTNSSLLDTLAARASEAQRKERTLGSRGSGAF